tara:strand:- start:6406 stop:7857 length:1452 start_codon:yes stop_codon:yes gene_type:complete
METRPTIVNLGPVTDVSVNRTATFEQAFGEHSELFGKKARGRRAKRKASRREDRAEKRTAKRTARNENKAERVKMRDERKRNKSETRQTRREDRKRNRQQARIQRRADRKAARQNMRDEQQARRQERRRVTIEERQARKEMRQGPEEEYYEDDMALEQGYDDGGYDDAGYDDYEEVGYDDGGYSDTGYDDGGYDDGGYGDYSDTGYDQGQGQQEAYEYDDGKFWEDQGDPFANTGSNSGSQSPYDYGEDDGAFWETGYDDYGFNLDGEGSDMKESSERRRIPVHNKIQRASDKLEMNLARKNRLESKLSAGNHPGLQRKLDNVNNRIADLQSKLQSFSGFDSVADDLSEQDLYAFEGKEGKRFKALPKSRQRQLAVAAARRNSKNRAKMIQRKRKTVVQNSLKPRFGKNRIVIPGGEGSSFDATSKANIQWDESDDPNTRVVELGSNFVGSSKGKVNWGMVALGVGVAIGSIALLNKYKVLGK